MNIDAMRRIKRAQLAQEARQRAVDEMAWLTETYRLRPYVFEYAGQQRSATFAETDAGSDAPNSYWIKVILDDESVIEGQVYITDSKGKRLRATAETLRQAGRQCTILRTLAIS